MHGNCNRKKEKYSLLFLSVHSSYSHSSLALPLLHSACRSLDSFWQWEGMEKVIHDDPCRIALEISEKAPDVLCTSLYLFNHEIVMNILQRVHALDSRIHIVAGGPQCTPENGRLLLERHPFLSAVIVGEGEEVLPGFLQNFEENKGKRCVIPESGRAIYRNWEKSPFVCCDPFFKLDKPFVQMETSRGCPMNCMYCTSSGILPRYRNLEQVKEELTLLQEKGVREIRVLDRTFNLPRKRGKELLELFARFPSLRFHLEFHPQFAGKELRETLKRMPPGLLHIEAGIQSLDKKVLDSSGRKSDPEKALDGIRFLVSSGHLFETHVDLIAGLPEQTKESLLSDIVSLMKEAPGEIQLETLKILPGTRMEKEKEKYGICCSHYPPYDVMKTSSMSAKDIQEMKLYSRLLDLFYNHKSLHPVMVDAVKKEEKILFMLAEKIQKEKRNMDSLLDLKKRALFLEKILQGEEKWEETRMLLAFFWLEAGFPVSDCPGVKVEIAEKIPEEAILIRGEEECKNKRETKFYLLCGKKENFYFAFNRAFSMNLPSGIWKQKKFSC